MGVLVDSERISNRVLAEMLTAEGLPTSLEDAFVEYKGLLLSDTVARAEQTASSADDSLVDRRFLSLG